MKQNSNILVLDSLRAFAAISVCLFHFVCTTTNFIQSENLKAVFSVGTFGVHAFFVISGFIIPWAMFHAEYKISDIFKFILKRIIRLEPPYVASILLCILVIYLRHFFYKNDNEVLNLNLIQILLHFGYLIPFFDGYHWLNPVYKTLLIEFQYYIFMSLVFIPLIKSNVWSRCLTFIIIALLSTTLNRTYIFYWLPVFSLGTLLFLFKAQVIKRVEFYIVITVMIIYCLNYLLIPAVVYACVPVIMILYFENKEIPLLNGIGKYSYSLYLIHPIIGASVVNILSHHAHTVFLKVLLVVLGFLVSIFSAKVFYYIIEKPSKKMSSSIKYAK